MSDTSTIGFIGAGNMASAILGGILAKGYAPANCWVSGPDATQLDVLAQGFGVQTSTDNLRCVQHSDTVILAVKPQVMQPVCRQIAPALAARPALVISIAAGIDCASLTRWLPAGTPLIRCMPNTPALVGKGAAGLYAAKTASPAHRATATAIFTSVGMAEWVTDESLMHAVTALSGSGPAYFFLILEALEASAIAAGMPADTARKLAIATMAGAAEMAAHSEHPPAQLKRNVMSPGGTTERAIAHFEAAGLRQMVTDAFEAARIRSIELSKILGEG